MSIKWDMRLPLEENIKNFECSKSEFIAPYLHKCNRENNCEYKIQMYGNVYCAIYLEKDKLVR
jgi:hypothetical protein